MLNSQISTLELQTSIDSVLGFAVAGVHATLKKDGALDFALIVSDRDCSAAGVFTKNLIKAAPVLVSQAHLQAAKERIRAVVVNTKFANAGTGKLGLENAQTMANWTSEKLNCAPEQVFVMSTGVIGAHLPMEKIRLGLDLAASQLGQDWHSSAAAIMTTDKRPKLASVKVKTAQGDYTIAGIAKGAGMIAPNMATMLSVIVTDAALSPTDAQAQLSEANEVSYNRIVVDGDTSTNDMVFLLANGASGIQINESESAQFQAALQLVTKYLAQAVVRDGEGVTKFITIDVRGAKDNQAAHQIANTIATSALVKTAFYGNDANWGRIIAAAGRAGIDFEPENASLWINAGESVENYATGVLLFEKGAKADYSESAASAIISAASTTITLDLGGGKGQALVWTCDLSHEYVSVNADYRT